MSDIDRSCRTIQLHVMTLFRSTLCSVMAQLTEETQPTFELTLRSRAVSEKSKVTFTCEVKGNSTFWVEIIIQIHKSACTTTSYTNIPYMHNSFRMTCFKMFPLMLYTLNVGRMLENEEELFIS